MNMNPDLCRAARAFFDWSRSDLAAKAGVSTPVIVKYERGGNLREETLERISSAFSAHGVTFTDGRAVQTIRYRKPPST